MNTTISPESGSLKFITHTADGKDLPCTTVSNPPFMIRFSRCNNLSCCCLCVNKTQFGCPNRDCVAFCLFVGYAVSVCVCVGVLLFYFILHFSQIEYTNCSIGCTRSYFITSIVPTNFKNTTRSFIDMD